jgi:uncharacterized repeat protein (TIGR02543 family)
MMMKFRPTFASLAVFALTLGAITGLGAVPASAAPVTTTIDYITYSADDTAVSAGAQATAYNVAGGTAVVIPANVVIAGMAYEVTTIGVYAFESRLLTSLSIPATVTSIGFGSFQLNQLTTLNIPTGVTGIGPQAFYGNLLTSVEIPATVTSIGNDTFGGNPLTTVNMNGAPPTINAAGSLGSFGGPAGVTVNVLSAHATAYGLPGSPTWQGYTTATGTRFVVDYDANGHGTAATSEILNAGGTATEPTPPTATGFVFDGWYDAPTGGTLWDFTTAVTTDTTLHAHWTEVVSASTTTPAALAATGQDINGSLTGGVILGALGFALLMIRRRKVGPTG